MRYASLDLRTLSRLDLMSSRGISSMSEALRSLERKCSERRAGLYVTTRGTRIGWLVSEVSFVAIASERGMPLTRPISWLRNERLYPR